MNGLTQHVRRWFGPQPSQPPSRPHDSIGETLRAAVAADARAKADNSRTYEARVQSMIDDLFLRMRENDANAGS